MHSLRACLLILMLLMASGGLASAAGTGQDAPDTASVVNIDGACPLEDVCDSCRPTIKIDEIPYWIRQCLYELPIPPGIPPPPSALH